MTWHVSNNSSQPAVGNWQDSVYLSSTPTITSASTYLGAVAENYSSNGGLAASGTYTGTFNGDVPAIPPGNYYFVVQVDSLYQLNDPDRANNVLAAGSQVAVSVPALTLGSPASGTLTTANPDQYYQVSVPAGGSLVAALASAASSGATALYISQGTEPTPYDYQEAADVANQPNQTAVVPQVLTAGTYYILVEGVSGSAATAGYTLTASQAAALSISGISSYSGGSTGNVTVEIDGTNFTPSATASLTLGGGASIAASAIDFVSASQIFATFSLSGAAVGGYTLKVQQGAFSATAPTTFQVAAPKPASLDVTLSVPQYTRPGRIATIVVTYSNPTDNDMVAPLLDIASTNSNVYFSTPDDPNNYTPEAQVLAVAPSGPAGILRPGQSGQLTLTLLSNDTGNHDQIPIQVNQIEAGQNINWASQQGLLQPANIPTAAWSVIFANLQTAIGTTSDSYNAALAQAASYLSGLGETTAQVSDVGTLWSFLVAQAGADPPDRDPDFD